MNLSAEEIKRYSRQLNLPSFGKEEQLKLKQSKIIVIGAGGLGCPLLLYLAGAGVGKIVIIDGDKVDLTNLHRQILFDENDIGKYKAETAAGKLASINSNITMEFHNTFLNEMNAQTWLSEADLVIDGSDNFNTRYLVNDVCVLLNKPFVSAAIYRHQGQIGVFNYPENNEKRSATYRCAFPHEEINDIQQDCANAGVLGVVPGLLGLMIANESIKLLTASGKLLINEILLIDTLTNQFSKWKVKRNEIMINKVIANTNAKRN